MATKPGIEKDASRRRKTASRTRDWREKQRELGRPDGRAADFAVTRATVTASIDAGRGKTRAEHLGMTVSVAEILRRAVEILVAQDYDQEQAVKSVTARMSWHRRLRMDTEDHDSETYRKRVAMRHGE